MAWVKFRKAHNWRITKRSMRSFTAGAVENLPHEAAAKFVADGIADFCDAEGNLVPPDPALDSELETGGEEASTDDQAN